MRDYNSLVGEQIQSAKLFLSAVKLVLFNLET
ncbi:hypothetical protein NIES3974_32360 [Calothrix sp. NIES-3974]|nr:hypothetical protein NIES3974_32360 [Calothrix sp. NIES-3974]